MIGARPTFPYGYVVAWVGLITMLAAFYYGAHAGHVWTDLPKLARNPWGIVTLIDIYVGFALFSCWIVWRERSRVKATGWIVLVLVLGNIAACVYVIVALSGCKSDLRRFWWGSRWGVDAESR